VKKLFGRHDERTAPPHHRKVAPTAPSLPSGRHPDRRRRRSTPIATAAEVRALVGSSGSIFKKRYWNALSISSCRVSSQRSTSVVVGAVIRACARAMRLPLRVKRVIAFRRGQSAYPRCCAAAWKPSGGVARHVQTSSGSSSAELPPEVTSTGGVFAGLRQRPCRVSRALA